MTTWRLTRTTHAQPSAGGRKILLFEGAILEASDLEFQTDPDWCSMTVTVFIHNDDLQEMSELDGHHETGKGMGGHP